MAGAQTALRFDQDGAQLAQAGCAPRSAQEECGGTWLFLKIADIERGKLSCLSNPRGSCRTCLTLRSAEQRSRNWAALRPGLGPRPDKPSRSGTGGTVWHGSTGNVRVAGEWRSVAERDSAAQRTVACRVMTDAVGCWESLTDHHVEQVRRIFSGIR